MQPLSSALFAFAMSASKLEERIAAGERVQFWREIRCRYRHLLDLSEEDEH
jgi:hypothetical protein